MTDVIKHTFKVPELPKGSTVTKNAGRAERPAAHAIFGASSASIWMNCPGMWGLLDDAQKAGHLPTKDVSGVYAREGSAAHEIIENALWRILKKGEREVELYSKALADAYNVTVADPQEFADATKLCIDHVLDAVGLWTNPPLKGVQIGIESTFNLNELYDLFGDYLQNDPKELAEKFPLFGTGDFSLVGQESGLVVDYKHGAGVPVDAKGNPQLKYYALGLLLQAERDLGRKLRRGVSAAIVQPRAAHADGTRVRKDYFPRDELFEFGLEVVLAVDAAVGKPKEFNPGAWCRFCKAASAPCPALAERARKAAQDVFGTIDDAPEDKGEAERMASALSDDELAQELHRADAYKLWINAVGAAASFRIKSGRKLPGWKAVRGRSPRAWSDPAAVAERVEQNGLSPRALKPSEPLSLPQMEKLAKRDDRVKELFDKMLEDGLGGRKQGPLTYAPENDPRPEVTPGDVFGELDGD